MLCILNSEKTKPDEGSLPSVFPSALCLLSEQHFTQNSSPIVALPGVHQTVLAAQVHITNLATDLFNLKWGISCSFNLSVNDVSLFVVSTAYQFLESVVRQAPAGPPSWAVLGTGCSFLALAQVLTAASSQESSLSHSRPNLQLVLYKPNWHVYCVWYRITETFFGTLFTLFYMQYTTI